MNNLKLDLLLKVYQFNNTVKVEEYEQNCFEGLFGDGLIAYENKSLSLTDKGKDYIDAWKDGQHEGQLFQKGQ